jgi:hypothetical protein
MAVKWTLERCLTHPLAWRPAMGAEFPYFATVSDQEWRIRINDFPAEPMYTLVINSTAVGDFDEWPDCWRRPA